MFQIGIRISLVSKQRDSVHVRRARYDGFDDTPAGNYRSRHCTSIHGDEKNEGDHRAFMAGRDTNHPYVR